MSELSHLHGKTHHSTSHHGHEVAAHHHAESVHVHLIHAANGKVDCSKEAAERNKRQEITAGHLHPVKVTDLERDKHVVADSKIARAERLTAARELLSHNISDIHFNDEQGHSRQLKLHLSKHDGRLRVTEGEHVILEDNNGRSYTDHLHAPAHAQGVHYAAHNFDRVGSYHAPTGGHRIYAPDVDPRFYSMQQNLDGSKTVEFNKCQIDTDGASFHPEDKCWQSHTSLRLSNGESLNTDLDNFVVLSPSLAKACGVKLGDCGYLVDKGTGRAVPVVFGDSGPEGKQSAEASVHAVKQLGRNERVDGNHGLEGKFEVVIVPKTGNGKGDLARNPDAIKRMLDAHTDSKT